MKSQVSFARPAALRPRDKVAVVAPAGPFDRAAFDAGLAVLAGRYQPVFDAGLFAVHHYLAGDDARRLAELQKALRDETVRAIFAARGGYGSARLLPKLALAGLPPKLVVGFSDLTALHQALGAAGWASIHGPVVTQLGKQPPESVERLFELLESAAPAAGLTGATPLVPGVVEGPLLGGNLSVLTRLIGTPYLPPFAGAVLLLEDVGERPYRLDRMWTHLAMAGVFQQVRGIALGEFNKCEEPAQVPGNAVAELPASSREVLLSLARETGLPCASGFRIGHGAVNLAVPLGCRVRLDATAGKLEFLEAAVRTSGAGP